MPARSTGRQLVPKSLLSVAAINAVLAVALVSHLFGSNGGLRGGLWLVLAIAATCLVTLMALFKVAAVGQAKSDHGGDLLIQYAYHDPLTNLPNRLLLRDRLSVQLAAIRRSKISVAMLMIDLDEFKRINDALGHLAGDELLVQVAERLSQTCRDTDTVARLGGDEFAVIQAIEGHDQAAVLGNRIIASLSRPFDLAKGQVRIGCSIGVTITQAPDIRLEELIDEADFALYRSKKLGGNVLTIFDRTADVFDRAEKAFETELVRAIAENGLAPVYLRQIDGLGSLAGVDAQLAWHHPELGLLDLGGILALVHDRRLAQSLIEHYLGAVAQAGTQVPTMQLTLNMLPLLDPERHLVDQLCCDEFSLLRRGEGCFLALKIADLERAGLRAVALVEELEGHGYGLMLDCGESSSVTLRAIARLRPSRLRLSSDIVSQIGISEQALLDVEALCALARSLGIHAIADGVATTEQSTLLNALGCDLQQGPLWGSVTDLGQLVPASGARRALV